MKKIFLNAIFVAVIAVVAGINVFNAQKTEVLSDIALANVEALASFVVNTEICRSFPGKDCVQLITTPSGSYYETYPNQINKTF